VQQLQTTSQTDGFAETVRQAQEGSEPAFAALVHACTPSLWHYLLARGACAADAEDVIQDTFIKAHRNLRRYDSRYAFTTWLFTIARRRWVDVVRARSREKAAREAMPEPTPPSRPTVAEDRLWKRAAALLSEREYDALWLRYAEDLPPQDVAAALDVSPGNARVLLHRARRKLAHELNGSNTAV
jgi:RNA polymerase sigma-70 factor (ECF subfamily)